jgi:ribosomal protein S18 acetylase RimI-like enzyme
VSTAALRPTPPIPTRVDITPLQRADHADYIKLLSLTTSGERLPVAELKSILAMPSFGGCFTHGPALCMTARLRRTTSPRPAGAVFASLPEWTSEHALTQDDPDLSALLSRTALCVHGVAVAKNRRGQGIARALLTETETRAREAGYRLATLLHKPELAPFYQRMGYVSAFHVTIALPHAGMGLTQPVPFMTAVKPLHPRVQIGTMPEAPGLVVAGLIPGWTLPPTAGFTPLHSSS